VPPLNAKWKRPEICETWDPPGIGAGSALHLLAARSRAVRHWSKSSEASVEGKAQRLPPPRFVSRLSCDCSVGNCRSAIIASYRCGHRRPGSGAFCFKELAMPDLEPDKTGGTGGTRWARPVCAGAVRQARRPAARPPPPYQTCRMAIARQRITIVSTRKAEQRSTFRRHRFALRRPSVPAFAGIFRSIVMDTCVLLGGGPHRLMRPEEGGHPIGLSGGLDVRVQLPSPNRRLKKSSTSPAQRMGKASQILCGAPS
jgi:hypothetical protein